MNNDIIKTTITEEGASPYQNYPQFGDSIYIVCEFDHRFIDIKKWCSEKTIGLYRSFNTETEMIGFWFSEYDDSERFEKEWM